MADSSVICRVHLSYDKSGLNGGRSRRDPKFSTKESDQLDALFRSSKSKSDSKTVPVRFQYIALAEKWNTTPWDVRENVTLDDIRLLSMWERAQSGARQFDAMKAKRDRESLERKSKSASG